MKIPFDKLKNVAIDFDGVIHSYDKGWQNGELYGELIKDSKYALETFNKEGFKVYILTARVWNRDDKELEKKKIEDWLATHNIFKGEHYEDITDEKIPAVAYIDDRGIRFTSWKDVIKYFH